MHCVKHCTWKDCMYNICPGNSPNRDTLGNWYTPSTTCGGRAPQLTLDPQVFMRLQGLQRVYDDIGDICLDVPNAYSTLGQIVSKGEKAAFITKQLAADVPQR